MTTKTNNLVTRVSELEAELAAARRSLRDEFAMAVIGHLIRWNHIPIQLEEIPATWLSRVSFHLADAMMIERDKR